MSVRACLPGLVAEGKISQQQADETAGLYDELHQDFRRQFGDQAADKMASDATIKEMEARALRRRRIAMGQIKAQQGMLANMARYAGRDPLEGGPINPKAAEALFDRDGRAGYSNVEGRRRAIRSRAHAMIAGLLDQHHTNVAGVVRMKAQLHDIVRELFGEDSGNVNAKALRDAWTGAAEMLRQRFNAAGGAIGKMERWGLPQAHDTRAVRAVTFDTWRDDTLPLLDRQRMTDERTGLPFSDAAMDGALRDVWETIRTDGWNKREAGSAGQGALANRRGDPRFLQFKDADSWTAYQEKYGVGTAFDAMMGHIDGMARDIAAMEVFGPNPAASVKWLKDTLTRSAQLSTEAGSKAVDRARGGVKRIDRVWDEYTGANGSPENRNVALAFSAIRSVETAAKLGGAVLSKPMELQTQISTRRFNGLASTSVLPQYVKLMRPGADHELAVRVTGIADGWSRRTASTMNTLGEELTGSIPQRLAGGVLKVTGMSRFTEAGRWALGMEIMGHVTSERGKAFAELDPAFQRALGRYGIGADGWDGIRATPLERDGGSDWIKPDRVANQALGDRLYEMIQSEIDYAVPVPDLRTRAMVNALAPKGNLVGELARSALLFKGFGATMISLHARRVMGEAMEGRGWNAARYAAGLFIGTTLMGALSLQMKAVARGEDPRQMEDAKFWGAATLQGGGWGIFGDFLHNATENRFGGGFGETLAGPLVSDADSYFKGLKAIAVPNSHGQRNPEQLFRAVRGDLPGGNLWYAKLAFDRLVTDQIQQSIDPNYAQSWARMEKRANDENSRYYWRPGETAPDHAPDLSNALGGARKRPADADFFGGQP